MSRFEILLFGLLTLCAASASGSKCPPDAAGKLVLCYYKREISLENFNICNCTHIIFTEAVTRVENNSLTLTEDAKKDVSAIRERKSDLLTLFALETKPEDSSTILKSDDRSEELIKGIVGFLQESHIDGIELDFRFRTDDGVLKDSYASFVKDLSKALPSRRPRVKREGYDVFEKLQDDVTTAAYPTQTPKNATGKPREGRKPEKINRKTREEKAEVSQEEEDSVTLQEAINREFSKARPPPATALKDAEEESSVEESKFLLFVRLSVEPELIAKKFDLKTLSRYADILTVPTHDIANKNEEHLTYHPSRLMGLSDILNTDSILDFLTGMGALKSKIVISLPATVLRFQLKDINKNTPRSPSVSKPQVIDQSQMCSLFSKSNWTIERDDDLTAPYAFSGKTWLAFEDDVSVKIKSKYILLRELAGGAIYPIDADVNEGACANRTGFGGYLTGILRDNFKTLERKPRALVLESLQEEIHDASFASVEAGVKLSEYRIVRVVDHSGAVHVIRKNTKTQFECSRQGYFSHPLGCNKFYRCVKFDQYSDEFTVFEYDCPAGLAFDERWEVCVWPGSLPHGAPCTGSSEIAPVPRSHYQCPSHEGYYADPENCRWFFACLDHARDGITPLTAYEFRCPFGLVFDEGRLACDWPWLVGGCGNRGAAGFLRAGVGGHSQGLFGATFINGGNLEASLGRYGNTEQEAAFEGFGSVLKESERFGAKGSLPAQSAGFGYIASKYDDNNNRASFASFPEYEISGGRVLNKGGLVLNENVNVNVGGISGANLNGGVGISGGGSAHSGTGYGFQQSFQSAVGGGHVQLTPEIELQKLTPASGISRTTIGRTSGGVSGGSQLSFLSPISTPRPFSVGIPSVQINEEKISAFSGHSNIQSTTAQSLLPEEYGNVQGGGVSFGPPTVSLDVTPKPLIHRFGQAGDFKQAELSGGISVTPPSVSVVSPIVTKSFQSSSVGTGSVTVGVPAVTPQPGVSAFEYTASGHGAGVGLGVSRPAVSVGSPVVGFTEQRQGGKAFGQSGVSVEFPAVTPTTQTHIFQSTHSGVSSVSGSIPAKRPAVTYGVPSVSTTQFAHASGQSGSPALLTVTPQPILHNLQQTTIDKEIFSEINFNSNGAVTPKTDLNAFSRTGSGVGVTSERLNVALPSISDSVSPIPQKTELHTFSQFGTKSYGGASGGKSAASYALPAVTPQADANAFGYFGGQTGSTPAPVVPIKNTFEERGGGEFSKGFSEVSFGVPAVTPQTEIHAFGQKFFQGEGYSGGGEISYQVPSATPATNAQTVLHTGGSSQGFVNSDSGLGISVPSVAQPVQPIRPSSGYQFSYSSSFKQSGNQFAAVEPFGQTSKPTILKKQEVFIPKVDKPKTITHVSIEQQPILSVGTISSVGFEQGASTPKPYAQSSGLDGYSFRSTHFQPKQVSVTTPLPPVSVTASAPVVYHQSTPGSLGANLFAKTPQSTVYRQEVSLLPETVGVSVSGRQEGVAFNQEVKSFTPVAHVTTSPPLTYRQEVVPASKTGFFEQKQVFLPPVTPKVNIFGSNLQQTSQAISGSAAGFGGAEKVQQQVLRQEPYQPADFEFVKTKPLLHVTEQSLQSVRPQVSVQVTTTAPEFQKVLNPVSVTTGRPFVAREELLDISKSVELNPSQFFQSTNQYVPSQSTTASPVVVQKQPVRLISQKTFSEGGVIQPFYRQSFDKEKEIVQTQINTIPQTGYRDQFLFRQQITASTPKPGAYSTPVTPKAYVQPISYSTAKTTILEQPVYSSVGESVTPSLSGLRTPGAGFAGQKETLLTNVQPNEYIPPAGGVKTPLNTVFFQQSEVVTQSDVATPKVTTEAQQYLSPLTEEISIREHDGFDFQRINSFKGGNPPAQNVFLRPQIYSTPKPSANVFQASGLLYQSNSVQNLTSGSGHALFGPGVKYAINPNIAIPEPPREYLLAQNAFTTVAPEFSTRLRFKSTTKAPRPNLEKTSAYLPPGVSSRKRPSSKTTLISVGNVDEQELHDDNIQQILDKYSGRFGEVIGGDKDKFVTKVIRGDGRGEIELGREGSSTVRYEISSGTGKQKSRGRQYHGGLTSGLQATNKYEEYEIEGDKESQRSFGADKGRKEGSDSSKTTIDLKNLKLDKNKKTVIVVSQVSDADPVLIGKLAGQCSCQSNMLELRTKTKKTGRPPQIYNDYLPPFGDSKESNVPRGGASTPGEGAPERVVLVGGGPHEVSLEPRQNVASSTTAVYPEVSPSTILSSLGPDGVLPITPKTLYAEGRLKTKKKQFRGRTRYLPPASLFGGRPSEDGSAPLLSPVPASEIASTVDYAVLSGDESRTRNEIEGGRAGGATKVFAGAAFDRYGPGGWRGFDETLQGSVDCKRPGLFRHPKYCNKFYACNYDPWKEKYTLHVFNCPIHLTYDSSISACNWPVRGPACADDNLLV